MSTTTPTAPPMSRRRLFFAILLGLTSPGAGIGLVSSAEEGIRLYLTWLLFSIMRITTDSTSTPTLVLPEWGQNLLILMWVWGIWAIIDIVNVIRRIGTKKILPELRGPYPTPLLWLAGCFLLIGLALNLPRYIFGPIYLLKLFGPLVFFGPFFIIIADRLLRRRSGWRTFTFILLAVSLAFPLFVVFLVASGAAAYQIISPIGWLIIVVQTLFILAALIILFLPSTRAFFHQPAPQPEVTTP